jgi:hypothetical protein
MNTLCVWCRRPISPDSRVDAKTCSQPCRQALHRFGRGAAPLAPTSRTFRGSMRFAYADPPYPGFAKKLYDAEEVDHVALIERLVRDFPDGWALSTHADSLQEILSYCPSEVRVCPWVKGPRRGKAKRPRSSWEPLIVCGGRERMIGPDVDISDSIVLGTSARARTHPGALVGMKPAAWCAWMFSQLGAQPGDDLYDMFPGSGAVARAWKIYTARAA